MEKPKSLGRDSFKSSFGFIIACIGSAVGMGNIWLFPRRVSEFGAPFLIAYLVCVVVIGFTGVIGEMAFGRASKAGPMVRLKRQRREDLEKRRQVGLYR